MTLDCVKLTKKLASILSKGVMEANRHLFGISNRHFFNKLSQVNSLTYEFKEILRWIAEGKGFIRRAINAMNRQVDR